MVYDLIVPFAKQQRGLVSYTQLRSAMTPDRIKHDVEAGRLEPVRVGVYRLAGAPESWEQCVLAACLARDGAVASFSTAGALWGIPGVETDGIEVTVEGEVRVRLDGVTVHTTTTWGRRHRGMRGVIPVTSMARTLCDLSSRLGSGRLGFAVDDALRRKLLTLRQFEAVAADLDGQGRKRCTVTRTVLAERVPGYQPGDSHPERRIAKLLVDAGMPRPKLGHGVAVGCRTFRLDIAYPSIKFAFEYDSREFHDHTSAFFADREKDALLDEVGWIVKRITSKTPDAQIVALAGRAHDRAAKNRHSSDEEVT